MRHLLLVLAMLLCFPAVAQATGTASVRSSVEQLAPLLADSTAKLDPASVDIYTENDEAVAVFTLGSASGGPASWQFVAFYERKESWPGQSSPRPAYRLLAFLKVGERGVRFFQSGTFRGGRLVLRGLKPARGDPTCCPSVPLRSAFSLKGGRVVEHVLAPNNSPTPKPLRGAA